MGIKFNENTKKWDVSYCKRHPITKVPISAKRILISSKAEANRIYTDLVIKVDQTIKKKIVPTWEKLLIEYLEHILNSDLTNKTMYNREKNLKYHTLNVWKDKFVDELKSEDILKLIHGKDDEYSEAHRKFILKCIRSVFEYALQKEYVIRNPTPLMKFKINDKIKSVLNEQQLISLLTKAQQLDWEWYPHCATAIFTGMRNGELYALTWDKVDLDKKLIKINCSWSDKDGFKSTKSGDDRMVEIPAPLYPLLAELKLKSKDSNFVLPRLNRWDKGEQARELRTFLKCAGLPEIRFHDLRASWATLLLGKGVAPSKVMSMGGWKDMDTMMIYMRKAGIDIKDSTSVLDNIETHGLKSAKLIQMNK